jgi:general secretion pathway protein K
MWTSKPVPNGRGSEGERGSALIAVMWLSLALSAIAFSLATTVRGETERTSTAIDGIRSYYLATGAIERAILYVQWGNQFYTPASPVLRMPFPTGEVEVEIIPESAKYNLNQASLVDLARLLTALGAAPERAAEIAAAIVDWRSPGAGMADPYYLSLTPSFRPRHASFEEIEELLVVKGMTPDLYYGTYDRDSAGQLTPRGGLDQCVSIYGATSGFDANTAHRGVLQSLGFTPDEVRAIVERRRVQPFVNVGEAAAYGPAAGRLRIGGNSIFTLRATARLRLQDGRLSDMRRSVAALVKILPAGSENSYSILRWYDNAWKD